MPLLNKFAKAPRCWPPPRTPEEIGDAVAYGIARDPYGTLVHLAIACFFCLSLPLSTALSSVSLVLLVGYAAIRLPNLWPSLTPLLAAPIVLAWVLWFAWTLASGWWTSDHERWRDEVGSFWCLAVFPALYPLLRWWRVLLAAFVAGTCLQAIVQLGQWIGWIPILGIHGRRLAGIGSHPGHVSTMAGMALLVVVSSGLAARGPARRCAMVGATLLCVASVLLGAGRGALVGLAVGGAVTALTLWARFGCSDRGPLLRRARDLGLGLVVAFAIGGWWGGIPESLRYQWSELERTEIGSRSSTGGRLLFWSISLDAFASAPLGGVGAGSTGEFALDRLEGKTSNWTREEILKMNAHSTYLQAVGELGAVGLAIVLAVAVVSFFGGWRTSRIRPVACGVFGAIVLWWTAAGFECLNRPTRMTSALVLVTSLACLPRGPGAGIEPRGSRDPG